MLKLILKNLWARRIRNAWLLAELILVTVLTWYITDPLFVLSYNQTLPLGYEPDGLLIAPIRSLPSTAPDYNKEEADSLHTMEICIVCYVSCVIIPVYRMLLLW